MMFKLTIEGTTMAELAAAITAIALQFQTTAAPVDKPAATRKPAAKKDDPGKAEAEAPNATVLDASAGTDEAGAGSNSADTAVDPAGSTTSTTATTDASPSDGPSRDDVMQAAMLFGQAQGDDALKEKITAMGATKFSEIPAAKYGEFLKSLEAPAASILD